MSKETKARFGKRATESDTCQHILQRTAISNVVMHIVGRDQRRLGVMGKRDQLSKAFTIVRAV